MTTIHAKTIDQTLIATVMPKVACNNQNTVRLSVTFDYAWEDYTKSAVFHSSNSPDRYEAVFLPDGYCYVPTEVLLEPGWLYISVKGVDTTTGQEKSSTELKYKILQGAPSLVISAPTDDVYHQLLAAYGNIQLLLDIERKKINALSRLEEGSTTGDAELQLIRIAADGREYESAGDAVREQVRTVHENAVGKISYSELPLTPSNLVSAVTTFDRTADYVTGYIFPVGKGVTYDITISGEANRFFVMGCYEYPKLNGACEALTGNVVESTNHIRLQNTAYAYFFVGIGYEIDTSKIDLTVRHDIDTVTKNHTSAAYNEWTVADFIECGVGDSSKLRTLVGVKGYVFPVRHDWVYELTVNGLHNRFSVYGIKGHPTLGVSCGMILPSPADFPNKHTVTFESSDYDYIVVNIGYNIESGATLVVREYEKTTYALFHDVTAKAIKREFYSTNADVANVTTTAALYALYDELVADHPELVSMTELGANLREYEFTTGDYNDCTPQRDIDAIIEKPVILIHTGTHGYERSAVMSAYQFFRDLCENKHYLSEIRGNFTFKIIPLVCPTSFDSDSRVNDNGVNIARNYSVNWTLTENDGNNYGGASACDQSETQICEEWLRANQSAALFIDFHNSGYTDEVSCLMGANGIVDVSAIKKCFLEAIHPLVGYWQKECGCDPSLIYAYTGNFTGLSAAYHYADSLGVPALCLETSWEQNSEPRHSANTIRIGAEVLGNMLAKAYADNVLF